MRNNFVELSAGNYEHVLVQMASHFDHHFAGAHLLDGRWHTVLAMRRWFERLYPLTLNLSFEVLRRLGERHTLEYNRRRREWIDRATLASCEPTFNQGVHFVRVRWGKVVSVHAYLDTQVHAEASRRMAEQGIEEAAAPITD